MTDKVRRSVLRLVAAVAIATPGAAAAQDPIRSARVVSRDYASELACGATTAATTASAALRIAKGHEQDKWLFAAGDPIMIQGGSSLGVKVGQEYFVRRVVPDRFTEMRTDGVASISIHTAGWVKIVDVQTDSAVAKVEHSCDAMQVGDYLEPFVMPTLPAAASGGTPDFENPGRIVLGDDRRQLGSAGALMVFDRGSDHGLRAGQRVTIFRAAANKGGPVLRIGEGTAMTVRAETTILRIDKSTDAIAVGDLVAIHR